MTGERLLKPVWSRSFKAFRMVLDDGRVFPVGRPELLIYIPGARMCVVADVPDKTYDTVDLLHVVSIMGGAGGVVDGQTNR